LAGNHVDLTDRATRCLSSLSLDFERFVPGHPKGSPDMQVQSVSVDGYDQGPGFWRLAPSHRSSATYLDIDVVYERPKAALIALRRILGPRAFDAALRAIQRRYAGSSITEPQAEAAFTARLPNHSAVCQTRLTEFFRQWFDTAYRDSKPQITGPGLPGHPFYAHGCALRGRR
jgi:hypothetical protein